MYCIKKTWQPANNRSETHGKNNQITEIIELLAVSEIHFIITHNYKRIPKLLYINNNTYSCHLILLAT